MQELRPGLHRWTVLHPEWEPGAEKDSPADWPQLVGCVAYDAGDVVVLVDPLVDDWEPLDALVAARPVAVVTTIHWHERSSKEVAARYPEAEPRGIELLKIRSPDAVETMVWIPEHRALVPGDRVIGDVDGGVRMCPPSWTRRDTNDELREALLPLLELPVELVLVSHGEPVLRDGHAALVRALG